MRVLKTVSKRVKNKENIQAYFITLVVSMFLLINNFVTVNFIRGTKYVPGIVLSTFLTHLTLKITPLRYILILLYG